MNAHSFLQAGDFSVRLSLETPQPVADGVGGYTQTWAAIGDVWARIVPVKGILVDRAENRNQAVSHWIYIRHRNEIEPGMRFMKGARAFSILTVYDPDETGRYLVCEVEEIN